MELVPATAYLLYRTPAGLARTVMSQHGRMYRLLSDVEKRKYEAKAQRMVVAQRPAPSPDAPGGVRALGDATDAAVDELLQWLSQQR